MFTRVMTVSTLVSYCTLLSAQGTAVFPSDHAAITDGDFQTSNFPYAYGVSRVMLVCEAWDLTVPAGRPITRIGVRQDGNTLSYGKQLQLQVLMAPTEKTADDALSDFASNYFAPPTSVFGPALYSLPDLGNVLNPNPTGNMVWLQLTTPYTPVVGKNLIVEFRVFANNNGGAPFNYDLDRAGFVSPRVTGPAGCPHSGNQIPVLQSRATKVGDVWYCDLSQAPSNQFVFWFIGFGPLQPQFPLAPFLNGINPGCQGQLALNLLFSVPATAVGGYHTFSVPIPNDRFFNDVIISSQALCFDFFAPGGAVVSNGDEMQIGIDPAMTMIYAQGSASATTGSPWPHFGVVTFFDWL